MKQNNTRRAKETLLAAKKAISALDKSLPEVEKSVKTINGRTGDIIVTGIGKSGFIGQKFTASLVSLGRRAFYIHPTDALHGDLGRLSSGDTLVALSFSGESREVVNFVKYVKKNFQVPVIVLAKSRESTLGKISDVCIEISITKEGSPNDLAPMASTTAMLVVCDMISSSLTHDHFKREDFAMLHPGGSLGLKLKKVKNYMKTGALLPRVKPTDSFLNTVKEMNAKRLGITAVVDKANRVVGVITDGDIRRFILSGKDITATKAQDVMTSQPKILQDDESFETAVSVIEKNKITTIFVVDKTKKLLGVIHIHDIIEETF